MAEEDELLTVADVARRLKLHEETIRRYIREGKLQAIRLGRTQAGYRIRASAVERYLNRPFDPQQPELPTKRAPKKLAA